MNNFFKNIFHYKEHFVPWKASWNNRRQYITIIIFQSVVEMHLFDCSFVNYVSVKLISVLLDGVKFCLLFLIGGFKPEQAAM